MRKPPTAIVDYATTVVILATCVFLVWANSSKISPARAAVPTAPQSLEGAALKGSPSAPVVIIEYADYQCPFCAKSEGETLPELNRKYIATGQVQLAFRHHPLSRLHPFAEKAAEAAVCAKRLGKFWEMHAALFADPKQLDMASLLARAGAIGLDRDRFNACMESGAAANQVRSDAQSAESLKLSATPAFLVGRRQNDGRMKTVAVLTGYQPLGAFVMAIDHASSDGPHGLETLLWIVAGIFVIVTGGAAVRGKRRRRSVVRESGPV